MNIMTLIRKSVKGSSAEQQQTKDPKDPNSKSKIRELYKDNEDLGYC